MFCDSHMKHNNTFYGQNSVFFNDKKCGTYSNHLHLMINGLEDTEIHTPFTELKTSCKEHIFTSQKIQSVYYDTKYG